MYSLAVNAEYYYKSTKIIATNTIIAAMLNLILNFIFIPYGGALAAAYTTVIAYACSFLLHYRYCRKLDQNLFPFSTFCIPLIVIVVFTVFQYLSLNNMVIRWCGGIVMILGYSSYILIKEKELIRDIIRKE